MASLEENPTPPTPPFFPPWIFFNLFFFFPFGWRFWGRLLPPAKTRTHSWRALLRVCLLVLLPLSLVFLPPLLPAATRIACFFWGNLPSFANSRVCIPTTAFSIFLFFFKKKFKKKFFGGKRKIHLALLSPKKEEKNKTKTKTKLKNKVK